MKVNLLLIENEGPSSKCSSEIPTKLKTPLAGTSHTPDMRRSASPSLEQLREAAMLSQIRKLAQIHRYMVLNFKKGPFFSQHESFDVDEETDLDNGELDSNDEEDIAGLRDVGRTLVESTKGV